MVAVGTIIWLSSELMFFAALFAAYFTIRSVSADLWAEQTQLLAIGLASVFTTILVLSSLTCQLGVFAAHQTGELFVDDADQYLTRRQAGEYFLTQRAFFDRGNEVLDDRQGDVGLQQGHAHFAHGIAHILFGQGAASPQLVEHSAKAVG